MVGARATLLLGHRGAMGAEPENTLRAFRRAIALGADGIECDVQRTADGELVLIHDDTVDRTTNGTGTVGEMTYAALAALDAGGGERIPKLADLLAFAGEAARSAPAPFLNLELKMPGVGPDTLALLARVRYAGPVALSSFDYPTLEETRRHDSAVELWILSARWTDDLIGQAHAIGATCLDLWHQAITEEVVARAAEAGLGLVSWTVNEPEDIRRLAALRPPLRALIGNYPERLRAGI